ncbi:hypothetical protein [Neobacillus jeddahensis]|uniref:hypothetical protein n=1 Tax=Neobacillus jeddahensis TaxID=1461580 RepID=UPI00058FA620|nr:hypothetical protein [Neobacillus jeddahensis]
MIGLMIAVLIFNFIALKVKKQLTRSQMVQVWIFSVSLQFVVDVFISLKYGAYWYFSKGVDWESLPAYFFLVSPVNIIFLNFYPFKAKLKKQALYMSAFVIFCLVYELVTLLPEPWGFFHYGWWKLWYSIGLNPILFLILLGYFKWICKLEAVSHGNKQELI